MSRYEKEFQCMEGEAKDILRILRRYRAGRITEDQAADQLKGCACSVWWAGIKIRDKQAAERGQGDV